MKITWLGTAAIRLEADGETVLFDPFVQLIGGENPNCLDDFLQDQTICVTHGHLDHLMEVPEFLDPESDAEATVYCGEVAAETLSDMVENTSNVVKVRPGDVIRLGDVDSVMEGKHAKPPEKVRYSRSCFPADFCSISEMRWHFALFESEISGGRTDADVRGACGGQTRAGDGKSRTAGGSGIPTGCRSSDSAVPGKRISGSSSAGGRRAAAAQADFAGSF